MVELPRVPRRLVTTEGARSSVTAADIASPYASLSRALTSVSETVENVGVQYAEQEGTKAVTRDAEGNLQVQTMPLLSGKSGHAYNRVARTSYLAQVDDEMDNKFKEKALEFQDKPQEFAEWSQRYTDELVGKQKDDTLANAVKIAAGRKMGEHSRSLMLRTHNLSQKRSQEAMDAKLVQTAADLEEIALKDGADTEGFRTRWADFNSLIEEKINNPAIAYPREKADLLRNKVLTQTYTAVVTNKAEKIYNDTTLDENGKPVGGYEAARKYVKEAARELGKTVKDVASIERAANAWITSEQRATAGERAAARAEMAAAIPLLDTMSQEQLDAVVERGFQAGAYREAADLKMRSIAKGAARELYNLSPEERSEMLRSGKLPARASGGSVVDRMVGAESGNDPNAQSKTSSAGGLGQFIDSTWLDMVKRHRPDIAAGKSNAEILALKKGPQTADLQKEMTGRYAEENNAKLRAAGVPVNDGNTYLAHFLGPGDAIKVLQAPPGTPLRGFISQASIDANPSVFKNNATAGAITDWATTKMGTGAEYSGPGDRVDLTKSRTGLLTLGIMRRELQEDLGRRITQFQTAVNKDGSLNLPDVQALAAEVHAVGTPEQKKNVLELAALAEQGQALAQLPEADREAFISAFKNKPDASAFDRRLSDYLEKANDRITKQYKEDPYAAHSFINRKPVGHVDFTNPQLSSQVIAQRVQDQYTIMNDQQKQPFSVLRPGEAKATAQLLTQGNAKLAENTLNMIAKLPPDMAAATLSDPVIRDAVVAMSRSSDPARMNPAMSVLDQQWQRNQATYNRDFPGTINSLQTWQTFKDTETPEELTKKMRFASDPSQTAARNAIDTAASEEVKKIKPDQIVSAFDTSFFRLPSIQGPFAPIDTPDVKNVVPTATDVDPLQSGRLTAEFQEHYKELRKSAVSADDATKKAIERLKINWKQSETNNNALTRHAPELYYPAVDGDHSYIRRQIETNIDLLYGRAKQTLSTAGVGAGAFSPTVPAPGAREYSFVATVADKQTEAEVAAKIPPTYQIVVKNDRTGRLELMFHPETGKTRWGFDPKPAQEAAERRGYDEPRRALEQRQRGLDVSGLGGAFREAQQRRIDEQRARLDRERPVNPNQPAPTGAQSVDEAGF